MGPQFTCFGIYIRRSEPNKGTKGLFFNVPQLDLDPLMYGPAELERGVGKSLESFSNAGQCASFAMSQYLTPIKSVRNHKINGV